MKSNQNTSKGKWVEIKGKVQKNWGKLTNDELDKTKGDIKVIGGLIQQKYGSAQKSYSKKLASIFKSFEEKKDQVVDLAEKSFKK